MDGDGRGMYVLLLVMLGGHVWYGRGGIRGFEKGGCGGSGSLVEVLEGLG